jgi:hypothetical protein
LRHDVLCLAWISWRIFLSGCSVKVPRHRKVVFFCEPAAICGECIGLAADMFQANFANVKPRTMRSVSAPKKVTRRPIGCRKFTGLAVTGSHSQLNPWQPERPVAFIPDLPQRKSGRSEANTVRKHIIASTTLWDTILAHVADAPMGIPSKNGPSPCPGYPLSAAGNIHEKVWDCEPESRRLMLSYTWIAHPGIGKNGFRNSERKCVVTCLQARRGGP